MKVNRYRYRSDNIITFAWISIIAGVMLGIFAGMITFSTEYTTHGIIESFNWTNALIAFIPLFAVGMLLFGLAQFSIMIEELNHDEDDEE
ncbi:MAG: hypothetical protein ACLU15_09635 [Ruminococcus sp.]